MDQAYCNYERMDRMQETSQYFVIRLKKNTLLYDPEAQVIPPNSVVQEDQHACLGFASKYIQHVFRFLLKPLLSYIEQLELFFRWIKQHLQVKQLFGTNQNAV
jgi:hypothetical protein